jgi:hypothetical protein
MHGWSQCRNAPLPFGGGGLPSQLLYQDFVGGPQDKSADNIGVLEVGQLVALSQKAPDVVP